MSTGQGHANRPSRSMMAASAVRPIAGTGIGLAGARRVIEEPAAHGASTAGKAPAVRSFSALSRCGRARGAGLATSTVAGAKVVEAARAGRSVPEGRVPAGGPEVLAAGAAG
jgi:hypothetical protein